MFKRLADYHRPAKNTPSPFHMISNDTKTLNAIEQAVANPELVLLSDWSHFTSEELRNISLAANIDPL